MLEENPIDESMNISNISAILPGSSPVSSKTKSKREISPVSDEEFISSQSYFPTSTPKNSGSTSYNNQRSVMFQGKKFCQMTEIEYFSESSNQSGGESSQRIDANNKITHRFVCSLYAFVRSSYPFDITRYQNLFLQKQFPILSMPEDQSDQEEDSFYNIEARYDGFLKHGRLKTSTDFDFDFFYNHVLLVQCSDQECDFIQKVSNHYRLKLPENDLLETLNNHFCCRKCGGSNCHLKLLLPIKICDRKQNSQIVHFYGDIAETLFGLRSSHLRTNLSRVFNNIRNILIYLNYHSNQNTNIQWILKRNNFHDVSNPFSGLQIVDFKAKSSISVGVNRF